MHASISTINFHIWRQLTPCCLHFLLQDGAGSSNSNVLSNSLLVPPASRRVIKGRAGGLTLHPSFNRLYKDVMANKASWQIEDCVRAIECFLPILFRPVQNPAMPVLQPDKLKKAYGHLRRFAAFHASMAKFSDVAGLMVAAAAARRELLEYAKLAEEVSLEPVLTLFSLACIMSLRISR